MFPPQFPYRFQVRSHLYISPAYRALDQYVLRNIELSKEMHILLVLLQVFYKATFIKLEIYINT